ncbi:hypothetical protein HTZ85_24295 [Escherichia coli]|nr:hypothetical protein [Escherichia coli]
MADPANHPRSGDCDSCSGSFCPAPFWRGEGNGRPAELGEMIGDFSSFAGGWRVLFRTIPRGWQKKNTNANIQGLIDEQRNTTGIVPGSRHLVLERCRDEIGDWRIILHSPMEDGCMNL